MRRESVKETERSFEIGVVFEGRKGYWEDRLSCVFQFLPKESFDCI
jgi:hypothetical protein